MPAGISTLEQLNSAITAQQAALSKRLKQVAAWFLEHPNQVAFGTVAEIAEAAGVHPSTLIRFANFFGLSGFTELQKLYKNALLDSPANYQQRIQQLNQASQHPLNSDAGSLLQEFTSANQMAMELFLARAEPERLNAAVEAMHTAETIYISGFRRSYSVATYLYYALSQLDVRAQQLNAAGGLLREQLKWLTASSLVVVITFHPYSELNQTVVQQAEQAGATILLITDSELCPLAHRAHHLFIVREAEVRSFRSLNITLCLAQTLCLALGYRRTGGG
ncbi:MAG: MurR/RpiR family transcriptional regulator [Thiolinea sp.]